MLVFMKGVKPENPKKNSRSRERTSDKLNPHGSANTRIKPGSQRWDWGERCNTDSWSLSASSVIYTDEGLKVETSVFESCTVANLPYRPCGNLF